LGRFRFSRQCHSSNAPYSSSSACCSYQQDKRACSHFCMATEEYRTVRSTEKSGCCCCSCDSDCTANSGILHVATYRYDVTTNTPVTTLQHEPFYRSSVTKDAVAGKTFNSKHFRKYWDGVGCFCLHSRGIRTAQA